MTRLLSAIAVLLVVIATPPIHAGQTISIARGPGITVPAGDVTVPSIKVAAEKLTASTVIKGNALDSTDGVLANVLVRLRDARVRAVLLRIHRANAPAFRDDRAVPAPPAAVL